MIVYSIYRITNLVNNKVYIGFTKSPDSRWKLHLQSARKENPTQQITRAIKKYGAENFSFEVIYQSLDKQYALKEAEPMFISLYESFGAAGYNSTSGGDGVPDIKFSAEECQRRSERMIARHLNGAFPSPKGVPKPAGFGDRVSAGSKGKPKSAEHRAAIAASRLGKKRGPLGPYKKRIPT